MPGVDAAMGGLMDVVSFPDKDLTNVIINGWPTDSPLFNELKILPGGRLPTAGTIQKSACSATCWPRIWGSRSATKSRFTARRWKSSASSRVAGLRKRIDRHAAVRHAAVHEPAPSGDRLHRPHRISPRTARPSIRPPCEASQANRGARAGNRRRAPPNEFIENVGPIKLSRAVAWATSAIALSSAPSAC